MSIEERIERVRAKGERCPACGAKKVTPRSLEQHRRFFAIVRALYHHWPETHERQFASEEECRKWIQMRAGHFEVGASIPLTGMPKERAVLLAEAAIRAAGSYAEVILNGNVLVVLTPKSIAFDKLGHKEFCVLNEAVAEVILAETGLNVETLLNEHEGAA
ncbi:MAG TPA: hypothetical protein VNK48_14435 [Xanthobacteraceae bacterium]|nr:hypothetical protein [Xanthobacteraceae bacterium]